MEETSGDTSIEETIVLRNLVRNYECVKSQLQPFLARSGHVKNVWLEYREQKCIQFHVTLGLCNLVILAVPHVMLSCFLVTFVVLPVIIGLLHKRTNVLANYLTWPTPSPLEKSSKHMVPGTLTLPQRTDEEEKAALLLQYRLFLLECQSILATCRHYLCSLYDIIKWEHVNISVRFYATSAVICVAIFVFPVYIFLIICVDLLVINQHLDVLHNKQGPPGSGKYEPLSKSVGDTASVASGVCPALMDEDSVVGEVGTQSSGIGEDVTSVSSTLSTSGTTTTTTTTSSSRGSGIVDRLKELRNRHVFTEGSCSSCQASFSPLLKRRSYCRHCGNHYCTKCCSYKVSKSTFGATAPGTKLEQVLVCQECYKLLTE